MSKTGNLIALNALFDGHPIVYYTEDPPYLPRILVFFWPVHTAGSTSTTSRIRVSILSAAGFKSFPAFQVSPSSSYYSAVHKLPEEKQRDEVSRGIAFSLFRYFSELSPAVKAAVTDEHVQHGISLKWGQSHAAQITCRLGKVVNQAEVLDALRPFAKKQPVAQSPSPTQMTPQTSIRKTRPSLLPPDPVNNTPNRFGFMTPARRTPAAPSRRTPSYTVQTPRKTSGTVVQKQTIAQMETLRYQMCEFADTEDNYVSRLQALCELVTTQGRTAKSLTTKFTTSKDSAAINAMIAFPALVETLVELNTAFLDDIRAILDATEESAMSALAEPTPSHTSQPKDSLGAHAFAKTLLAHFPKFLLPYREYLDLHPSVSANLSAYLKPGTLSTQTAPALLMEPAQRISRYSLYIDAMLPNLGPSPNPSTTTTASLTYRTLTKSRALIAEICAMEPAASTILDGLRIEHEDFTKYRSLSPTKLLSTLRSGGTIREAAPVLRDRDKSTFSVPSLGRSFSRKTRSGNTGSIRGMPKVYLGERAVNTLPTTPLPALENERPRPATGRSEISVASAKSGLTTRSDSGFATPSPALEWEVARLRREIAALRLRLDTCTCRR